MFIRVLIVSVLFLSCDKSFNSTVPISVLRNFQLLYPHSSKVKWEIDKHGNYEAKFIMNDNKLRADFLPNGHWIETEQNISFKQLPDKVKVELKKNFDYSKIYEIEKVHHFDKGWFYDVEIKIEGRKRDVEFRKDGSILN